MIGPLKFTFILNISFILISKIAKKETEVNYLLNKLNQFNY